MEQAVAQRLFSDLKRGLLTIQVHGHDVVMVEPLRVVNREADDLQFGIELREAGGRDFVVWNAEVLDAAMTNGYQMGRVNVSPRILLFLIHEALLIVLFPEGSLFLFGIVAGLVLLLLFGGVLFPLFLYPRAWWPKLAVASYTLALIFLLGVVWHAWRARRLVWRPAWKGRS
jgi:hypothetical protein